MPNKENIRKWVDALRSGKYKQGKHYLKRVVDGETQHCCLGVACEVSGLVREWTQHGSTGAPPGALAPSQTPYFSTLPNDVVEWLGLDPHSVESTYDPEIAVEEEDSEEHGVSATAANDSKGWDFNRIADALEKKYLL